MTMDAPKVRCHWGDSLTDLHVERLPELGRVLVVSALLLRLFHGGPGHVVGVEALGVDLVRQLALVLQHVPSKDAASVNPITSGVRVPLIMFSKFVILFSIHIRMSCILGRPAEHFEGNFRNSYSQYFGIYVTLHLDKCLTVSVLHYIEIII